MATQAIQVDLRRRDIESSRFEAALRRKIVGQDEVVQAVIDLYHVFRAPLNAPGRPVGNLLFLGPTGAGDHRARVAKEHFRRGLNHARLPVRPVKGAIEKTESDKGGFK